MEKILLLILIVAILSLISNVVIIFMVTLLFQKISEVITSIQDMVRQTKEINEQMNEQFVLATLGRLDKTEEEIVQKESYKRKYPRI